MGKVVKFILCVAFIGVNLYFAKEEAENIGMLVLIIGGIALGYWLFYKMPSEDDSASNKSKHISEKKNIEQERPQKKMLVNMRYLDDLNTEKLIYLGHEYDHLIPLVIDYSLGHEDAISNITTYIRNPYVKPEEVFYRWVYFDKIQYNPYTSSWEIPIKKTDLDCEDLPF